MLYGQTRIMFAMYARRPAARAARRALSRRQTPARITSSSRVLVAVLAALVPLSEIAKLVNIGTLFAFLLVNIGVMVLRRTRPDIERGFRVPFVPVCPLIGAALCIYLMKKLVDTLAAVLRVARRRARHLLRLRPQHSLLRAGASCGDAGGVV